MTYGNCPALSQSVEESAGLKLSASKGLSIPPAVIGPSRRDHCLKGRNHPCPWGIKSVSPLRQFRVSTPSNKQFFGNFFPFCSNLATSKFGGNGISRQAR